MGTNWYSIFYWLTVSDGVKKFFDTSSNVFTTFAVLLAIPYVILFIAIACLISQNNLKSKEEDKTNPGVRGMNVAKNYVAKMLYISLGLSIITWFGYVATPNKKDCLLIIAGGAVGNFLTTDTTAKKLPADLMKYLHLELTDKMKDLSDDTKKELGLQSPKEKVLDKMQSMTKEEIINYVKSDSALSILTKK